MEHLSRYFLAALAFAFVVTWATVGAVVAFVAAAACCAVVYAPGLRGSAPQRRQPRPRRTTPHELVPDDPSLILSVSQ